MPLPCVPLRDDEMGFKWIKKRRQALHMAQFAHPSACSATSARYGTSCTDPAAELLLPCRVLVRWQHYYKEEQHESGFMHDVFVGICE